jgi:hypothetical protein
VFLLLKRGPLEPFWIRYLAAIRDRILIREPQTEPFVVKFDHAAAWTILYADPQGEMLFTFEASGPTALILNWGALEGSGTRLLEAKRPRVDLAFERVKRYLEGIGYSVTVFGRP